MKKNKVNYNFGKKGTAMIIYSGILLYFMTGLTVDGLNIIVPGFAALKGWDSGQLLSISTPASIIALILTSFWGGIIKKFGLKNATTIALVFASISLILFANSTSILMYGIMQTLVITFINCFAVICGFSMIANWFPKKKGIVLGFSTMGMNMASATMPTLLTVFGRIIDPKGNIIHSILVFAGIILVVGILNHLFVKATPEEVGLYPDNELPNKNEFEENTDGKLTYKDVIMSKTVWKLGLAYGFAGMGTVGIMSQLIPYLAGFRGFSMQQAIMTMSVAAIIGIVGSYSWGYIDQRMGTKFASQIFGIWYALAIILLIAPGGNLTLFMGIAMIGFGIGGTGNFPPSMTTACFGRQEFAISYSVVNMIMGVTRSTAFVVLGIISSMAGSMEIAYIVFLLISLLSTITISLVTKDEMQQSEIITEVVDI